MGNMQKWIGLGLAVAIGVGNGIYAFNPSFKEEKERREGEVLGGTLRPRGSAPPQEQTTSTPSSKDEPSRA